MTAGKKPTTSPKSAGQAAPAKKTVAVKKPAAKPVGTKAIPKATGSKAAAKPAAVQGAGSTAGSKVATKSPATQKVPAKAPASPKATGKTPAPMIKTASAFQTPVEKVWALRLGETAAALEQRGYETSIVPNAQAAAELVFTNLLPASGARSVGFGGSMTVVGSGLYDALKVTKNLDVLDTNDTSKGVAAMIEMRRKALTCDFYLSSANALTREGVIMVLDGIGNRGASIQFGPLKVVLLIGRNKICDDIESGFARVKAYAAPANSIRLDRKNPCAKTGYCMDCSSPERICSVWTILERCFPQGRIHVVLINEDIGF